MDKKIQNNHKNCNRISMILKWLTGLHLFPIGKEANWMCCGFL